MGYDQERGGFVRLECFNSLGNGAHRVHIEAGVGLIQNSQRGLEQQKLQNLSFLLLSSGKTDVEVALRVGRIHVQRLKCCLHFLPKAPYTNRFAALLGESAPDEILQRDAGNFNRVLEREEEALLGPLAHRELQKIFTFPERASAGNCISGIPHQDACQRRLACAVGPHDHVGLAAPDPETYVLKNFGVLYGSRQMFNF